MGGGYTHQTKGTGMALAAEINKMKVEIDALHRALANIGLRIDATTGDLITDEKHAIRSANFDGDLDTATPGTVGWALGGPNDNAVFNTLALRGGIIGNAALANPVSPGVGNGGTSGWSLGTAVLTVGTATIPVPAGFSRALVTATSDVIVMNDNSFGVTMNVYTQVGTVSPTNHPALTLTANEYASVSSTFSAELTGLSGGSISCTANAYCSSSLPADPLNAGQINATALFLR